MGLRYTLQVLLCICLCILLCVKKKKKEDKHNDWQGQAETATHRHMLIAVNVCDTKHSHEKGELRRTVSVNNNVKKLSRKAWES